MEITAPASMNITVTLPAIDGTEATERTRAALIKKAILDLKAKLKDNSRDYNGYGFYASLIGMTLLLLGLQNILMKSMH